jgi:hypothetical protein
LPPAPVLAERLLGQKDDIYEGEVILYHEFRIHDEIYEIKPVENFRRILTAAAGAIMEHDTWW